VAVSVTGGAVVAGDPQPLFDAPLQLTRDGHTDFSPYAVSKDGRFLFSPRAADASGDAPPAPLVVVLNWFNGVKR
jgi:hypothetical protein